MRGDAAKPSVQEKKKKLQFVGFVNSHGVFTTTMADFKLPMV